MKKVFALSLALCLLTCGCQTQTATESDSDATKETDAVTETTKTTETTAATEEMTEEVTEEVTEEPVATEETTEPVTEVELSWQELYAYKVFNQIENATEPDAIGFALIYIDDDDTPELHVKDGKYSRIFTVCDNNVVELETESDYAYHSFTSYLERQGVYYSSSTSSEGTQGVIDIWRFENGTASRTDQYYRSAEEGSEDFDYYHNNALIPKKEYDAVNLQQSQDAKQPTTVNSTEILKELGYANGVLTWKDNYRFRVIDYLLRVQNEEIHVSEPATYSLIYINDDEIPELLIDSYDLQELYTFVDDKSHLINSSGSYRSEHFSGFREKSSLYWLYDSAGSDNWYFTIMKLQGTTATAVETIGCDSVNAGEYHVAGEYVTEEEAEKRLAEYRDTEPEYKTYTKEEILAILSE